ncbi:RNA-binding protein [Candidatus Peregrinibacteria bacterium]|jgi:RNA recognition motif-containing protein|nr:RNA-binding protein [Candidatus Peregrinibacteria bacterium]MBT4148444.1 RNA-binding protein [Candidatus Peregrinibacteria bacterium]MBT4456485.1 RNA-binding protein [Candidatus Peregrinibacteria bacterium]
MAKKLFVGSLAWETTQEELQELFAQYGDVEEAIIISDKFSGRSKGFGFVTFTDDAAADEAIAQLNETEFKGRKIVVNEAKPPRQ